MKRHVVLIGLPGSGKTTVARLVGAALGVPFEDADEAIARRAGRTVREIFADSGEAAFRALEREVVSELLAGPAAVIAPGGGWAGQPGALESAAGVALIVHLHVTPATALGRLGDAVDRPLLRAAPRERLRELEAAREPYYGRADAAVDTEGRTPAEVAAEVVTLARSLAGW